LVGLVAEASLLETQGNIEIVGRLPRLLCKWISPAISSLFNAALAASRFTQNEFSDKGVSFKGLPFAIPFSHHMANC